MRRVGQEKGARRQRRASSLSQLASRLGAIAVFVVAGSAVVPASVMAEGSVQYVEVRAGEADRYYFSPERLDLTTGEVEVRFINEGLRPHTFNIKDADWRDVLNFDKVESGSEATFRFTAPEPGSYFFYCILYKHVDMGQVGELTVWP